MRPDNNEPKIEKQKKSFPVMKRANKSLSKDIEAFELDVTPFMNLMMFFIPFLATMAAFTHLAIVEFSLPPAQAPGGCWAGRSATAPGPRPGPVKNLTFR